MNFSDRLKQAASQTEQMLDALLPSPVDVGRERSLFEAMRYATLGGGKRLRAFLVIQSSELFNVNKQSALRVAAAIECLHAYSLIHDDLPAMDDDNLRRGKPTVHIAYTEATAILAGDALQTLAFEILAHADTHPDPNVRISLIQALATGSGGAGMVGGQAIDLAAETAGADPLDMPEISRLQSLKTGALIEFSCLAGAILGNADKDQTNALKNYAEAIGLAFQIQDDILDVEGDEATTGKRVGKDEKAGKATFVSLLGLQEAKIKAQSLVKDANYAMNVFDHTNKTAAEPLRQVAEFVIARSS